MSNRPNSSGHHSAILFPAKRFEPCADLGQVGGANHKKKRHFSAHELPGAVRLNPAKVGKAADCFGRAWNRGGQFLGAQNCGFVSHGFAGAGRLRSASRAARAGLSAKFSPWRFVQRCKLERATPTAAAVLRIECGSAFRPIEKGGVSIVTV
jgi:hypothetical protein